MRLLIAEEERIGGKVSAAQESHQRPAAVGEAKKTLVTYQPSEQVSPQPLAR